MGRKKSANSLRARALAIVESAGNPLTASQIAQRLKLVETNERQYLQATLLQMANARELKRHKDGQVFVYSKTTPEDRKPVVMASVDMPPFLKRRPLVADPASQALASPPRGKGAVVPSMASASLEILRPVAKAAA